MISAFIYCPRLVSFKAYIPGEKILLDLRKCPLDFRIYCHYKYIRHISVFVFMVIDVKTEILPRFQTFMENLKLRRCILKMFYETHYVKS